MRRGVLHGLLWEIGAQINLSVLSTYPTLVYISGYSYVPLHLLLANIYQALSCPLFLLCTRLPSDESELPLVRVCWRWVWLSVFDIKEGYKFLELCFRDESDQRVDLKEFFLPSFPFPPACLSIFSFTHLSIHVSIHLTTTPPTYLHTHPSV